MSDKDYFIKVKSGSGSELIHCLNLNESERNGKEREKRSGTFTQNELKLTFLVIKRNTVFRYMTIPLAGVAFY